VIVPYTSPSKTLEAGRSNANRTMRIDFMVSSSK
jgi:hypothetical protein